MNQMRSIYLTIRVTPGERAWLRREANQTGLTVTDILLRRAGVPVGYRDPSDYSHVPKLPFKEKGLLEDVKT